MEKIQRNQLLVRNIIRFLDATDIMKLREVASDFKEIVDTDRHYFLAKLELMFTRGCFAAIPLLKSFHDWIEFCNFVTKNMNLQQVFGFTNELWDKFGFPRRFLAMEEANIDFHWSVKVWGWYNCDWTNSDGESALYLACKQGHFQLVQLLIEWNPQYAPFSELSLTNNQETIFHAAASGSDTAILKYILETFEFQETVNIDGNTALDLAMTSGSHDVIEELLNANLGFNLEAFDGNGNTLLHRACMTRELQTIFLLDSELASIDSEICLMNPRNNFDYTPFECLIIRDTRLNEDNAIECLIEEPELSGVEDSNGGQILLIAAYWGNLKLVKFLADFFEMDFNATDDTGETALHVACFQGRLEIVEWFVENKAKYDIKLDKRTPEGFTPEDLAKECGHQEIAELLKNSIC